MELNQPFTISRNTVFWTLITTPATAWLLWIVVFIGLILIALGCFFDLRYLILGLIVCLTVLPTMAFFQFINYMFATEMVANLLNHTIERHNDGYLVRIFRPANQEEPIETGKTWIETGRLTLFDSNIIRTKSTNEYEVVFFKDSSLSILYIPKDLPL